jgi:uncharacterized membrane protein
MSGGVPIRNIALTALMGALIFVLTAVPRIPVPATGGYIHLGDVGVTFAACAFGPWVGMTAGGLGTALADLLGFPQWAVFSLVVHGLQGLAVGWILSRKVNWVTAVEATVAGTLIVVAGYYLAGTILEGPAVAALEVLPNTIQGLSGGLLGLPLFIAVRKAYPPLEGSRSS